MVGRCGLRGADAAVGIVGTSGIVQMITERSCTAPEANGSSTHHNAVQSEHR
jgi:hypothetical protein